MKPLRFAVIGAGFWSRYQIAAWKELKNVELVAICDKNSQSALTAAQDFQIATTYNTVEELFANEKLDFVDIITDVESHEQLTKAAAEKNINIICQKPMASSLSAATRMVEICRKRNVKLFVHENFRWQAPVRAIKEAMNAGTIGRVFNAHVSFCSAFPVFENQPFLAQLEHFILTDIGSHVLDICRFLFGEVKYLTCLTQKVNKHIKGEDVANVMMQMQNGCQCLARMSYASVLEKESFPQTLIVVEGEKGSLNLTHDFCLKVTTTSGTTSTLIQPKLYDWVDPDYSVVHSSIVDCNQDILNGLRGGNCETSAEDNLRTVELVWSCYHSATTKQTIKF